MYVIPNSIIKKLVTVLMINKSVPVYISPKCTCPKYTIMQIGSCSESKNLTSIEKFSFFIDHLYLQLYGATYSGLVPACVDTE